MAVRVTGRRALAAAVASATALAGLAIPAAATAASVAGVPAVRTVAAEEEEVTPEEKVRALAALGIFPDNELILMQPRDFVFQLWRRSPDTKPEVKAEALAAHDQGPEACELFIRVGVYAANERDKAQEVQKETAARLAREAKSAAAAVLGIVAPPEMLVLSDWDFIAKIWEHPSAGPLVKQAAFAALQGSPAERTAFIATGLREAHRQDVLKKIEDDEKASEAEKEVLRYRAVKAAAAAEIGVVATEEVLVLSDDNLIRLIWDRAAPNSEVAAAAMAALRSPDPARWRAFIETGIFEASRRDLEAALRKKAEEDRRLATQIKAKAENSLVHPALVAAAGRALAGTPDDVAQFLMVGQYEALTQSIRATTPTRAGWYVRSDVDEAVISPGELDEAGAAPVGKATWKVVSGLADPDCHSFESVDHLGHYLRHKDLRVMLAASDGSSEFKNDATWCARKGLSGEGVSLESKSRPGRYLRHVGTELWAANDSGQQPRVDRRCMYAQSSSWQIDAPNPQVTEPPAPASEECSSQDLQWGKKGDVPVPGDYDADGKSDFTVWRPSTAQWFVKPNGGAGQPAIKWGAKTDVPVPGDYNADGKADFALWRPANGQWWIKLNGVGNLATFTWGVNGDIPVPGDYNNDGKADFTVWRPSTGQWWVKLNGAANMPAVGWGVQGDVPVAGDYNNDGKNDFTVWRPSTAQWWVRLNGGATQPAFKWGIKTDVPVPGDYNNDGKADFTVWRPANGQWWVKRNGVGNLPPLGWGRKGDVPVPGDYNEDGLNDYAIFRPSSGHWWISFGS